MYALKTADGVVSVDRSYYRYSGGTVEKTAESTYVADYWNYTQDGYLIFSGIMYTEELYLLTLSETEECKAFRVQPLGGNLSRTEPSVHPSHRVQREQPVQYRLE